jgi:hypothetical protein
MTDKKRMASDENHKSQKKKSEENATTSAIKSVSQIGSININLSLSGDISKFQGKMLLSHQGKAWEYESFKRKQRRLRAAKRYYGYHRI